MKRYLYTFLYGFFLCIGGSELAFAQQNINSTVEVQREYEGKLLKISKSQISTNFADSLLKLNLSFDYSTFNRPYKDLYDFTPINSIDIAGNYDVTYPSFYSKFSYSYPIVPFGELYYAPKLGDKFALVIDLHHDSFWGKSPLHKVQNDVLVKDGTVNSDRMANSAGLNFIYSWKNGELYAGGDYDYNYYTFFGLDDYPEAKEFTSSFMRNNLSHTYSNAHARVGVRSTNANERAFKYDINLKYGYLDDRASVFIPSLHYDTSVPLFEHKINANLMLGYFFNKIHSVKIKASSMTVKYGGELRSNLDGEYDVAPSYNFIQNRWKVDAGVSFSGYYSCCNKSKFFVFPKIYASYEVWKNHIWLFAKVDGNSNLYTSSSILDINPWAFNVQPWSSVSVLRTALGFRGTLNNQLNFSIKGGYSILENLLMFSVQAKSAMQEALYVDRHNAYFNANVDFRIEQFKIGGEFNYNYYNDVVYMMPELSGKLFAEYNLMKRFFFGVSCGFRGETFSNISSSQEDICTLAPTYDLGVDISYVFNNNFTFFIQGRNLLNQDIQYVRNYSEKGLNIGAGVCLKF